MQDAAPERAVPALRATNLRVRYRNGALGVLDVSFEVAAGGVIALLGPNGAGKTTSVRAVTGFLRSDGARVVSGSVELFGRDVTNWEPHTTCRAAISFVPERAKVFATMSVAENLMAIGKTTRCDDNAMDEVLDLFPILAERRDQAAGRLSGGQQQMLAIARALLTRPRVLIVDEMTLGLHHSLHAPLFAVIERIAARGVAVVIVDESAGFALRAAQHCYLLNGGRIRFSGPASELRGSELLAAGYVE